MPSRSLGKTDESTATTLNSLAPRRIGTVVKVGKGDAAGIGFGGGYLGASSFFSVSCAGLGQTPTPSRPKARSGTIFRTVRWDTADVSKRRTSDGEGST